MANLHNVLSYMILAALSLTGVSQNMPEIAFIMLEDGPNIPLNSDSKHRLALDQCNVHPQVINAPRLSFGNFLVHLLRHLIKTWAHLVHLKGNLFLPVFYGTG